MCFSAANQNAAVLMNKSEIIAITVWFQAWLTALLTDWYQKENI